VGQLVAEAIRAYGDNFWRVLPLGIPLALLDELALGRSGLDWLVRFLACAPLLALAFAYACTIVGGVAPTPRRLALATLAGTIVLLPTAAFLPWFALLAVAYLALAGLAYTVLVGTLLGSGIWSWLMARHPAGLVAPFSMLVPVVGLSAAWVVLGETLDATEVLGAATVVGGVLLGSSRLGARHRLPLASPVPEPDPPAPVVASAAGLRTGSLDPCRDVRGRV